MSLAGATSSVKSVGGTFKYYLVVIQNLGNIKDRFKIHVDPTNAEYNSCDNPDFPVATGVNQQMRNVTFETLNFAALANDSYSPWLETGRILSILP